jgi:hypothetical protein
MKAQHTADNILVDLDAESQRDLLSNAGTAPTRIPSFHRHDGVDEVFLGSLRAPGRSLCWGENNMRYFRLRRTL